MRSAKEEARLASDFAKQLREADKSITLKEIAHKLNCEFEGFFKVEDNRIWRENLESQNYSLLRIHV